VGKISIDLSNLHSVINEPYYPYLTDKHRYFVSYGGAGSGKSVFIAQKFLIRILVGMRSGITHKFICLRKTMPAARKSIWALFEGLIDEWKLRELVKINKSELSIKFENGSEILVGGLDDPEKLKSIYNITGAWLEEANEMSLDDFMQVDLRIRGQTPSYKQISLSFNPISKLLWVHDYFFVKKVKRASILHTTYKDNRFLDAEYVDTLESLIDQDPTYHQIYARGEWGVLKNTIYNNWEVVDSFPEFEKMKDFCFGLDFGYVDPSVLTLISKKEDDLFVKQLVYERKLTNDELIVKLKEAIPKRYWRTKIIYCDNAEPARIEEINKNGLIAKKADKSVKDGLDFCKRNKINIHSDSTEIIQEIQGYKYREKDGQPIDGEPVKFNDHTMDSFRYGAYTHWGKHFAKSELIFI
jgi:phage terminase large subunit